VDDHLMGITHVMRGEEWLPSTPKHALLYQFFDWKLPKFIHLPLLLNPDKSKLSKRQGDVTVEDYLQKGYLSEAIINFVALLGWHPKNDQEIFSLPELEKEFSLKCIHKSGAVFDIKKLNWMNSQYLMHLPLDQIAEKAKPYFNKDIFDLSDSEKYLKTVDNARCRVNTLAEIPAESKMFYGEVSPSAENSAILKTENAKALLSRLFKQIQSDSELDGESFKQLLMETGKEMGIKGKELFAPARIALYGNAKGPEIPLIYSILGKTETLNRLKKFI
jgi:glutamyl-tRNA synthetase